MEIVKKKSRLVVGARLGFFAFRGGVRGPQRQVVSQQLQGRDQVLNFKKLLYLKCSCYFLVNM